MRYVGIDIGAEHHFVAAVDEDESVLVRPTRISEDRDGYERLRETLQKFVSDLRASGFAQLGKERQIAMYSDYLDSLARLEALARRSERALVLSLGLNNQGADPSSPPSAAAQAGSEVASARERDDLS